MKTPLLILLGLTGLAIGGISCKTATVTSEHNLAGDALAKPTVVYVADFAIAANRIDKQPGFLSDRPGPVGRVGDRLSGGAEDPSKRAQQLVDSMAESLVQQFSKAGFTARRLEPGASLPAQGWLVRGAFTEVQEGNRLQRSMVGFGQGQTDLQVITSIDDLSHGPPKPLYEIATDATSGQTAGAAPTLAVGPYGAAARFVMAGKDLDKNVKQTAEQIVSQLVKHIQAKG